MGIAMNFTQMVVKLISFQTNRIGGAFNDACINPNPSTVADVQCIDEECELICKPGFRDCNINYTDGERQLEQLLIVEIVMTPV